MHLLAGLLIALCSLFLIHHKTPKIAEPDMLPTLNMTAAEFQAYNRLATMMDFYHGMLRSKWYALYDGCAPDAREPSVKRLINIGQEFCFHLKGHHDIEETMWFPVLGRKMDGFRPGHFATSQHKQIHKGLDVLMPYLEDCKHGKREMRRAEVREIMDSFGGIMWQHLDEEVKELGAENMRKYWTLQEMKSFPM